MLPQPEAVEGRYEAVVVGGGIIGSVIAYTLVKKGLSVALLDAGLEGEATPASAGMLAPYPEGLNGELLTWAEESLTLYPELVAELEEHTGLTIPFACEGTLLVHPAGTHALEGWPEKASRLKGHLYPGGYVHPQRLKEALWATFQKLGGVLLRGEAKRILPGRVETAAKPLHGRYVVLAVGAWAARFGLQVRPMKGEALWLEAPAPPIPLFWEHGYMLPREDGLYVGATQRETWRPGVELEGLQELVDFARKHLPNLQEGRVRALLWGYRPMGELFVGEVETGTHIYAAGGHGRNGILLAPVTAKRLTETILGTFPRRKP